MNVHHIDNEVHPCSDTCRFPAECHCEECQEWEESPGPLNPEPAHRSCLDEPEMCLAEMPNDCVCSLDKGHEGEHDALPI